MKKIVAFTLLLCMVLTFAACGKVEITMQEIYDANQIDALFKTHQNVYFRSEMDGELWIETYLTKDYIFNYMPGEEYDWLEFLTHDACYYLDGEDYVYYVYITPDGVTNFASDLAERSTSSVVTEDTIDEVIESVSKKDGLITVKSVLSQKSIENMAEFGVTSGESEYVLDAKTHEIVSLVSASTYDNGTSLSVVTKVAFDTDTPEKLKTILAYESQTENLRNITIVSNPGAEKEETKTIQVPKGLIMGFQFDDSFADAVTFYIDAACERAYDPYANTDSDLTIYIKWANT